jgi:type I restriction-modification system DNA methylase subunit
VEKATEDTYVAELVSVIRQIGGPVGFDAEFNKQTPSGRADVNLLYRGKLVAVIEVKIPGIPLSDPSLKVQAERYAEWYRKNRGVNFYGIHNLKYLNIFKYIAKEKREKTLLEFMGTRRADWASISDFPFRIMPWVKSISEFKQISTNNQAQKNVSEFLLKFKETLEGKTLDLSSEVIDIVKRHIEEGASRGLAKFHDLYRSGERDVRILFENWRKGRGIEKPKNDNKLKDLLALMIKEQLYTLSMKVLFYLVLQNIDAEMSSRLKENLATIEPSDAELFQKIFDMLFKYAIERSGDFEEVFGTNTVDRLPLVDQTLQPLKELISYLSQIRWSEIKVDIIGRVFEGLIYTERRHLLGQHYTDTPVVDLILAAALEKPGRLLDPGCGSGTFLVRALNYWSAKFGSHKENFALVEGVDIDKLASMLSKINLYIQALEMIKEKVRFCPNVFHRDFFKMELAPEYLYVVTNPPYTRQEEMTLAFYDREYKKHLVKTVEDIEDWSKKASIYAYFLIRGGKLLQENGTLGFIIENSWLNAEYGGALKKWLMNDFTINYIIESLAERWFGEAAIITNILIAKKSQKADFVTKFIYLKKRLSEIFGTPPPATDSIANERYYENLSSLLVTSKEIGKNGYAIEDSSNCRIVHVKKSMLQEIESKLGKWGILKGPKKYLEIILGSLVEQNESLDLLDKSLELEYGIKTNANELFYLPSKYWTLLDETQEYLRLKGPKFKSLKISKRYLRPLIRPAHIEDSLYAVDKLVRKKHEDYVLWVEDSSKVEDPGTRNYLEWVQSYVKGQQEIDTGSLPTLTRRIESATWARFSDKSGAMFLLRNDIDKNFAVYLNRISVAQVDKRIFMGNPKVQVDNRTIFGILNSVFTYLGAELVGRSNLGEGALDVNFVDYYKIPTINPVMLEEKLEKEGHFEDFLLTVNEMLRTKPASIDLEAKRNTRMKMEEFILSPLDLSKKDIMGFYDELQNLVSLRAERAASTKKRRNLVNVGA